MDVRLTVVPPRSPAGMEYPIPIWPADWPPPRVDDEVTLPYDGPICTVHAVDWLPHGENGSLPFVYVVLWAPR